MCGARQVKRTENRLLLAEATEPQSQQTTPKAGTEASSKVEVEVR